MTMNPYTTDDPIKRFEYEARHLEIQRQMTDLKVDIANMDTKFDKLAAEITKARVSAWQFIAVTSINFILSGGLIGFLAISGHFH